MSVKPTIQSKGILQELHKPFQKYVEGWLDVPAHLHHSAHRMANPPMERPQSRKEFQQLLQCLGIDKDNSVLEEKVGYGVTTAPNGDRLIAIWEAHTEYYSYQIWHIPVWSKNSKPLF